MSNGNSLSEEIKIGRRAALEGKDWKYKLKYYFYYYKYTVLAIAVVLVIVGSFVKTVAGHKENALSVAVINGNREADYSGAIEKYEELVGISSKEEMSIDDTYYLAEDAAYSNQYEQKLYLSIAANQIDVIIGPEEYFDKYAAMGCMYSLDNVLSAQQLERYQDKLHYLDVDSGENGAKSRECVGIAVLDISPLLRSSWYPDTSEPVYMGITSGSGNIEHALGFLEYIQK